MAAAQGWRRIMHRLSLHTVSGKMVAVFLLLTFVAMQVIGLGLISALRAYYVHSDEHSLSVRAGSLAQLAASAYQPGSWQAAAGVLGDDSASVPNSDPVVLIDAQGKVQWSTTLDATGQAFDLAAHGLTDVAQGRSACAVVAGQIWCGAPVVGRGDQSIDGAVLAAMSADELYQAIAAINRVLLTWTVAAMVIIGILSLLVARAMTGPIGALTRRARAMAVGDFSGRLPVQGQDEVGQLARVFNQLVQRLQDSLDEIRAEQQRLAAVLDNMTDGILALDAHARILLCNPSAAAMLDIDARKAVGQPIVGVVPAQLAPALLAEATGVAGPGMPLTVRTAAHHLSVHVAPLVAGRALRGTVVVLQDVTAREQLEEQRREFVANVSHELRTPVTTIKLYAESLLEWGLEDAAAARPKVEVIATETERMVKLIGDLLLTSQLGQRQILRHLVPVRADEVAAQVALSLAEFARKKGVEVAVRTPAPVPAVLADADRIVQVVTNLLANAIDFTPPGGSVRVAVAGLAAGGIELVVTDTGIGIPAEALPRIFDRFYRVDMSRSREHGGSGLGLSIARDIIEAHGGQISADSQVGAGTSIRFTLPPGGLLT